MKLGLTLEGGASRTYFSNGVMDVLLENNIKADCVTGASAGIANAISYVSGQIGRNMEIGEKYACDKRYMGFRHMLRPSNKSYYNLKFVFDDIPNIYAPFDYEAFEKSTCDTFAALTNIETGQAEYMKITGEDKTWQAIIASCSLPIMFRPVKLGGKLYMDGGIVDCVPVGKAFEEGCDKNIVVITRERGYVKTKETGLLAAEMIFRKYSNFVEALQNRVKMYNESHEHLLELERDGKIFLIAPEDTKGWGRTDSKPEKLKSMYDEGRRMTEKRMGELLEYLEK